MTIPERLKQLGTMELNGGKEAVFNYYLRQVMKADSLKIAVQQAPKDEVGWENLKNVIIDLEIRRGVLKTDFFICLQCDKRIPNPPVGKTSSGQPLCETCSTKQERLDRLNNFIHKADTRPTYGGQAPYPPHKGPPMCWYLQAVAGVAWGTIKRNDSWDEVTCQQCLVFKKVEDSRKAKYAARKEAKEAKIKSLLEKARTSQIPLTATLAKELTTLSISDLYKRAEKLEIVGITHQTKSEKYRAGLIEMICKKAVQDNEAVEGDALCRRCRGIVFFLNDDGNVFLNRVKASASFHNKMMLCTKCLAALSKWSDLSQSISVLMDKAIEEGVFESKET